MAGLEEALLRVTLWINMGSLLLIAGAGIFLLVVWRSVPEMRRPPSVEARFTSRWRRTVVVSWVLALLSSIVLLVRADQLSLEAVRLGLILLGGVVWLGIRDRTPFSFQPVGQSPNLAESRHSAFDSPWLVLAVVGGLLGLLVSLSLTGHARQSSLPVPNMLVAFVHVTGAAAWVGGLAMLVAVAFPAVRGREAGERATLLAPVVARFSDLALWSVVVVVASGAYTAWTGIGELEAVTGTTYGWVFLAKLSVFLPALALGAINKGWTKPRLMKAAQGLTPAGSPVRVIRRLVLLEVVLVAAVLGLTAFLVALPPPSNPLASAIR
jgi:uncharacterized membrane protein